MRTWLMSIAIAAILLPAWLPTWAQVQHSDWFPGGSGLGEPEIVPPAFRGMWAPDSAGCTDIDGVDRISIIAAGLESYESGGRLDRVAQSGQPRSVLVKLAFEGEGRFWDSVQEWSLNEAGNRLTIVEEGDGSRRTLVRCD